MRMPPLPSDVGTPRLSGATYVRIAAASGAAACGLAGVWPRFHDTPLLRIVLAITCAMFGVVVVSAGLRARKLATAIGASLAASIALGVLATVAPSAIIAASEPSGPNAGMFLIGLVFGAFFGAPTGFLYGIALTALVGATYRNVTSRSHDGADRAARAASIWLLFPALVSLVPTMVYDLPDIYAFDHSNLATWVALGVSTLVLAAGASAIVLAHGRVERRRRWLEAVREGKEPTFRLRNLEPRDDTRTLPLLTPGMTVLEWVPDAFHGVAYRDVTSGIPVALVAERPRST